jgi:nucleotide-binding universal stress UspA family protein
MNNQVDTELPFVTSVLHPTDFSVASQRAFAHALAISLVRQTELIVLNVSRDRDAEHAPERFPQVRETLERWGRIAPGSPDSAVVDELNIRVNYVTLHGDDPGVAIMRYLDKDPVDMLVLATEGRKGLPQWLAPSVAESLARSSKVISLFVPGHAQRDLVALADGHLTLRNIVVPVDHRPDPAAALEFARRTAVAAGQGKVTITLLHIGDEHFPRPKLASGAAWSWRLETVAGEPVDVILRTAHRVRAELIIMTTAGREGVLDALRGSTTEQVLRQAPCPLMAVPAV